MSARTRSARRLSRGRPLRGATLRGALLVAVGCLLPWAGAVPDRCGPEGAAALREGWDQYRAGRIVEAKAAFGRSLACETHSIGARVGLGYAALREQREDEAARLFEEVLDESPDLVDAHVGRGLLAWRIGDSVTAFEAAVRAIELDPANEEALALYARTAGVAQQIPRSVDRPPLQRPDTVVYPARTRGDRFEIRTPAGWEPFYVKGVNLGAALPGRHPSQFPDATTYAEWIFQMVQMGANAVRVYTIHPPSFYEAVRAHNLSHPDEIIWLIHGVWTGLPPEHDYEEPEWEEAFFTEMRRVVDLLHGRADLPVRPGHASGSYTADVAQWTLAYIIGREWEPYSVVEFNRRDPDLTEWNGRYLRLEGGTPMDVWLAKACERIIAYEMDVYHAQRPVAYTNWPTLDPLYHPTETTVAEEVAIRSGLGERVGKEPFEYDNDSVSLSAFLVHTTSAFPAGYFASYHAYPYYPDFMLLDPEYGTAASSFGPSNYFRYLRDLKDLHPGMPVVIAEYGVPASLGIAHLQPQGWHHGGHDEAAMARVNVRLTREIAAAGMAGGAIFAWIDEWFKKNWLVIDFEIPRERNRLWLNRLDAEQHYGMFAMEPGEILAGDDVRERLPAWRRLDPLYMGADGASLRATADEAYLWLLYEGSQRMLPAELLLGFDIVDPDAGDFSWPERLGPRLPVGVEFVLRASADGARLLVDPSYNPFRLAVVRDGMDLPDAMLPPLVDRQAGKAGTRVTDSPPLGVFAARLEQRFNRPYRPRANEDGRYDSLRVVTNRPRFGRDSTEYLALGYDRGILPGGPQPDGLWEWLPEEGVVEVRIPWLLLNVTDPSQRRVLLDPPEHERRDDRLGSIGTVTVPDIGVVVAAVASDGIVRDLPGSESARDVARFTWPTWEAPRWRVRKRPVFDALREAFRHMQPVVALHPSDLESTKRGEGR